MTETSPPFGAPEAWLVQENGSAVMAGNGLVIVVPSGQVVTLQDVIWNEPGPEGLTLRFRFIAPSIAREGGTVAFEDASGDMMALCRNFALPRVATTGPQPAQIIVSLSDIAIPFGEASPDATQYFEAYSIVDGECVWDIY
jgi:hypothetical protein